MGLRRYLLPVLVSLALHVAVITLVVAHWAVPDKQEEKVRPKFIEAKLVEMKPKSKVAPAVSKTHKPKKIDLAAKRKKLELEKRAAEKKRQLALKKKAEQKKAEQQKQLAQEKKLKAEREKQARDELARLRQLELQRQVQQQMENELEKEHEALLEQQYASEAQSYGAAIRARIERNWSKPPSARKGMMCQLRIQLVPTGRLVSANIIQSSGNSAFDRSALQAVQKTEEFPEIKRMSSQLFERHFRQFTLTFHPEDSRL